MQLAIDIGNTRVKWCLFEHRTVIDSGIKDELNRETLEELMNQAKHAKPIVATVVKLNSDIQKFFSGNDAFIIDHETRIPITNTYATPATLGMDRLCCAIGASSLYPKNPVLAIDAGTCLKFEFVDENHVYQGGTIAPGLRMRLQSLNDYTSKLPLIESAPCNNILGNSTESAIRIGVQQGMKLEIQAMINQMNTLYPNLKVVGTGGDITFFANALKTHIFADSLLVLRGINEIYLHNS